jgi:mRNA-degrading endonuclease RelE of RelBE toxin-antitoxin system
MAYGAALTKRFLRELRKQANGVKERALIAIDEIIANPFLGVKLRGELEGRWRWKIGKYRIIYIIDDSRNLVVFLDIGPRKSIYE